jgi:hypothetical protein
MSGVVISSGQYGFPLIYDLLLGTVLFKVHPNDKPNNRGRLLLRMFLPSDYNQIYLSVLCSFQIRAVECLDQSERSAVPSDALRRHRDELPPT